MDNSTPASTTGKPTKPYADFPLYAHASGRWAKKIRGRLHYFGPWSDPQGALDRYLRDRDDLHAGRTPRAREDEQLTLRGLANRFLTAKRALVDSEEITPRTWADYHASCGRLLRALGKERLVTDLAMEDFAGYRRRMAKKWGPTAIGNEIQRIRSVFRYGFEAGLLEKPVRFGPDFKKPSKKTRRQERARKGKRMFEAEELRAVLEVATPALKAMILLGVNCGFGNADVGTLPLSALDLEGGWVTYPRPKTGVERKAKLWPETVAAIKEWLPLCPRAKNREHDKLVFVTKYGDSWHNTVDKERLNDRKITPSVKDPVADAMAKTIRKANVMRPGLNFYALRHTHETVGGESRDQVAVDHIMGHSRDDMASHYRERISDQRLEFVANVVRDWLFPVAPDSDLLPMKTAN
jgi:integrase